MNINQLNASAPPTADASLRADPRLAIKQPDATLPPDVVRVDQSRAVADARLDERQTAALREAVKEVNAFIAPRTSGIEFSIDEDLGKTVVKLVDTSTNTILKQYPSEKMIAISKDLHRLEGLLLKEKA